MYILHIVCENKDDNQRFKNQNYKVQNSFFIRSMKKEKEKIIISKQTADRKTRARSSRVARRVYFSVIKSTYFVIKLIELLFSYTLQASTFQMAVLLQYNDSGKNLRTFTNIRKFKLICSMQWGLEYQTCFDFEWSMAFGFRIVFGF